MDFFNIIAPNIEKLSNTEQELLNYVLEDLNAIKSKTIREVADDCFVSTTTFLRFVKKIGFSGYSEFITIIKYTLLNQENMPGNTPFTMNQTDYREEYLKNIIESVRVIEPYKIDQIIDRLIACKRVYFYAKDISKVTMQYIKHLFTLIGIHVVSPEDKQTRSAELNRIKDEDVVFFFGYKGEDVELLNHIRYLRRTVKALLVSITGADNNLFQNNTDINLYIFTDELTYESLNITSHVSMIAIMELIMYKYLSVIDEDIGNINFN